MLKRAGNLTRTHHGSKASASGAGKGICHLCMGGAAGFEDWHDINGSWVNTIASADLPWSSESPLTGNIPQSLDMRPWFHAQGSDG